ncbi:MAG: SDR family oxidoreductase [Alphaproteobacteria bacterium]|nr:SDR family oxidoreductase [Alphaproteobacteria bacterium]
MAELKPIPKTALVTGAAHRIGRAIVLALVREGWAIAVHYQNSRAEAEALASEIISGGGRAAAVQADLSREADTAGLVAKAVAALGPVGLVVNNASQFERDTVETATRGSWDQHIETNLRAPFVLIQALARRLPADTAGAVINLLDQRVWNLTHDFVSYTLSKAGLWTLTQTMALALAPRIRVNGIGPGPVLPSPHQSHEQFRQQWEAMPLGRGAQPEEIAAAVLFILSAPAMTGQMIALDGGQHLCWAPPKRGQVLAE